MKKLISLLAFSFCLFGMAVAQDDLLDEIKKEESAKPKKNYAKATFKATRIINMQSVEMTGEGNLQFMITHHFPLLWNKDIGSQNLVQMFGLNSGIAKTYLALDYSPKTWFNFGLAAAGTSNFEGWTRFKLMAQQTGVHNYPFTIDWISTAQVNSAKSATIPGELVWNRWSFMHQLLIARKMSDKLSLQFMPTLIHNNLAPYGINNSNNIWSLGMGGRYKLSDKKAITFEYARQLNMHDYVILKNGTIVNYNPNLVSLGYDWDTGGHIFQLFISSTTSSNNIEQLSRNPYDFSKGEFSLGFNINRTFGIKKKVKGL